MPLHWLFYRHHNQISVVVEPAHSLIYARLRASLNGLDEGEFTEGRGYCSVSRCIVGHICVLAGGGEDGVAGSEGDDWATAIAGGSEAVVGEVRVRAIS